MNYYCSESYYNMDDCKSNHAEWKKTLENANYFIVTESRSVVSWGGGGNRRGDYKGALGNF